MPNCAEFVELLFGISLLGAVMVPINARFAPRELGYVIENGDLEVVFTSDRIAEHADYVGPPARGAAELATGPSPSARRSRRRPAAIVVLFGDRARAGDDEPTGVLPPARSATRRGGTRCHRRTSVREVALIMYTSGTTAMPKGCLLSHEALVRTALVAGRTRFQLTAEDRFWDPLPMFHMSAILPIIGVFDAGATFLSMTHFDADEALAMIDRRARDGLLRDLPRDHPGATESPRLPPRPLARHQAASTMSRHPTRCARCRSGCRTRSR